eukprot:gene2650-5201_t
MTLSINFTHRNAIITTVAIIVSISLILTNYWLPRRHCHGSALPSNWKTDPTYQRPYIDNTISTNMAMIEAVLIIPLICIKAPPLIAFLNLTQPFFRWTDLGKYSIILVLFFIIGAGIMNGIVNIMKNELCSLRPYAALRPDDPEAYLSTPSGHTSDAVYTAVYVTYWINKEIEDPALKLLVYVLMSVYPIIVGATRITDNHHWPVDVLAGATIGIAVGIGMCYTIEALRYVPNHRKDNLVTDGNVANDIVGP